MAAKKSTRNRRRTSSSPPPLISQLRSLIAAVKSPEDLKPPIMKHLYLLLVQLSLNEHISCSWDGGALEFLDKESSHNGVCIKFKDVLDLFDTLFEELVTIFKHFFSAVHDISASQACGEETLRSDMCTFTEELNLLLRCCMISLNLIAPDQEILIEKGRVILSILSKLLSLELSGGNGENNLRREKKVSQKRTYVDDHFTTSVAKEFVASLSFLGPSNPTRVLACSLIEVVADELLVDKTLREYFMLIDSASSSAERLYVYQFGDDKMGCVLELISAHFILSVSDEKALENFHCLLFWQQSKDLRTFEMSLPAALALLLHPVILSVPKTFQTYLICLVSEVIYFNNCSENKRPYNRHMNYYLTSLERSVFLYTRHLSNRNVEKSFLTRMFSPVEASDVGSGCHMPFESYLQPATMNNFFHILGNLNKSLDAYKNNVSFETNSDLVASSISYAKDCITTLDNSCKEQILSILSFIVLQASDDTNGAMFLEKEDIIPEDMYLLASILKLMSSSLKQVVLCMRCNEDLDYQNPSSQVPFCREYEVLLSTIGCFKQFDASLPIQKFILETMEAQDTRHKESKWMLLHLSGLLSISYATGLDFLVKGCIFTLITLLNLLFIEEGNLEAFESSLCSRSAFSQSKYSAKIGEVNLVPSSLCSSLMVQASASRKSSQTVASKFQKMRTLCTSMGSLRSSERMLREDGASPSENASDLNELDDESVTIEEEIEETSNGEIFLKCMGVQKSDFDSISDFIECKPGRDYSEWLKGRHSYRQWKQGKTAVLRWKKKKKIWKYIKESK